MLLWVWAVKGVAMVERFIFSRALNGVRVMVLASFADITGLRREGTPLHYCSYLAIGVEK